VVLRWDSAYARAFALQTSRDAKAWTTVYTTSAGSGGVQTVPVSASGRYVRMLGISRATRYGYSLREFQVYGTLPPPRGRFVRAEPQVAGVQPSHATPPPTYFHEFQANCRATHDLMDDPIVHPGQPGASHQHTFLANTTTNAGSTLASLRAGGSACTVGADRSAYWIPTMYDGTRVADPVGPQVIYYKSGVTDYRSVRPFPPGGGLGVREQLRQRRLPAAMPGPHAAERPLPGAELLGRAGTSTPRTTPITWPTRSPAAGRRPTRSHLR